MAAAARTEVQRAIGRELGERFPRGEHPSLIKNQAWELKRGGAKNKNSKVISERAKTKIRRKKERIQGKGKPGLTRPSRSY